MPKTVLTPRKHLVCGKIDALDEHLGTVVQVELLRAIRHDCERMEAKLISRKDDADRLNRAGYILAMRLLQSTIPLDEQEVAAISTFVNTPTREEK